jgi:hypothetical protein
LELESQLLEEDELDDEDKYIFLLRLLMLRLLDGFLTFFDFFLGCFPPFN